MTLLFLLGVLFFIGAAVSLVFSPPISARWRLLVLCPLAVAASVWCSGVSLRADDGDAPSVATDEGIQRKFERPEGWPDNYPLPTKNTNCVRCHLHAGRELTGAVRDFCRSVHDLIGLSCADCHGGNTEDNVTAHEEEFGFIGTKLSAHLANCALCHEDEAALLAQGAHAWDWSERINLNYPMCVDCHGNHDIGDPPEDFLLADVCFDCHDSFDKDYPEFAALVDQNDKFWNTLTQVRQKNFNKEELVPKQFTAEIDTLRNGTMRMIHSMADVNKDAVKQHNKKVEQLRQRLATWLKEQK